MISLESICGAVSQLDGQAQIIEMDGQGRRAVRFRAFSTDAMITATKPDAETLIGCVIFAEITDPRLSEAVVNVMNQRINFGGIAYFDPQVAIVKSGQLFNPADDIETFEHLLTAWSDTIDQFWTYLQADHTNAGVN